MILSGNLMFCDNYSFYKGTNKDLWSLLNKCVSIIGKRTYKNRLLYACFDENIINKRYNIVEILINQELYIISEITLIKSTIMKKVLGIWD